MTSLWKALTAIAALVFAASAVWLVVELLNGDGVPLLAVGGLIVAAVVLLLARARWLSGRGIFYEELEDTESDEGDLRRRIMPAAPSAPVSRGWGRAPEFEEAHRPAARPAAPSARQPVDVDDLELSLPDFLRRGMTESRQPDAATEPEGESAPAAPAPAPPAAALEPPQTPEPARFAAYYPREVKPGNWQPLRAYMFRASASQAVQADALAQFGPRSDIRATAREALRLVVEDALVTAIPSLPGFEFDPPQVSLRFRGDWRRFDFEFQAASAPLDVSADGHITFLVEGVIVADVPLSVYVSLAAGESGLRPQMALSEPYQAIFCSYSHKDTAIVERVERASRYFNFRYLRDVTALRSGEAWNARLLELIDSADIFQLFWSKHAAESDYVRQEYQYAAALRRKGAKNPVFIRPIRWEDPMPAPPPPELSELHFDLIPELAAGE